YAETEPVEHWLGPMQDQFAQDLCRLMVACNIAWWAADHPYWTYFWSKYVPAAQMLGRARLLDDQVAGYAADASTILPNRDKGQGRYIVWRCYSWKNIAMKSIVLSMINVKFVPHPLHSYDISAVIKNAENLLEIVLTEILYCTNVLGVQVIAWCTDCSGEALKMCRPLHEWFPWIVTVECWAHQIDLVVGNYFKINVSYIKGMDKAIEIVKWFNNHS
ncbi:hypothetical protein NEOLEDRAFT_1023365, partial [Neolentinus lepideus HHB14362 ss-1]